MVSYVAICDDDTGSRKHLERLLTREADARMHSTQEPVILYTESYGNEVSLMATPMKYFLFIIHITDHPQNSMEIAAHLHDAGVLCPIFLIGPSELSADILSQYGNFTNVSCLSEPVTQKKVSSMVDSALDFHLSNPNLIELRDDKNTYYVTAEEILYGTFSGCFVDISLTGKRTLHMLGTLMDFSALLSPRCFFQISRASIINIDHIQSMTGRNIQMSDNAQFTCDFLKRRRCLNAIESYRKTPE